MAVVVVCGAAQKATAMITQKPHSGTDLHIGSPSAAIESEILCFDYNLWPTSAAPLIALNPAPIIMRAMNAWLVISLPPHTSRSPLTKTRDQFFSRRAFVCKLGLSAWFCCNLAVRYGKRWNSAVALSICWTGAAGGSVIATTPFLIGISRAGICAVRFIAAGN